MSHCTWDSNLDTRISLLLADLDELLARYAAALAAHEIPRPY
ncbi:DUF6959 family protein [Streptomyces lunaelactis]